MKEKISVILYITLFFLSNSAYAQKQGTVIDRVVASMTTELNLTKEQADGIYPIIQEYYTNKQQAFESIMERGITDNNAIKSQIDQLHQEVNQKLSRYLTQDQIKKWDSMQSQLSRSHHGRSKDLSPAEEEKRHKRQVLDLQPKDPASILHH